MPFEYVILLLFGCCIAVAIIVYRIRLNDGETSEQTAWANVAIPLIYEQRSPTIASQQQAKEEYLQAIQNLELYGNEWLGRTQKERAANVHLWIWGADSQNTHTDFEQWKLLNITRAAKVHERFRKEKAINAAKAGATPDLADVYGLPDFDDINEEND